MLALAIATPAAIADWPAWRGPTGQGHSAETGLPLTWSATENVRWRVPLADPGNSTPVVWGDKVFLTQANKGGTVRSLICFARADGKILWQQDVRYDLAERAYNPNWYANASPATDGERVVVSYGSAGLYCYDPDGKELWKRTDLGKWEHTFGNSASPVLYADLVIQWCGPSEKGRNYLLAVNKKTGATVWEHEESFGSWSTPLIARVKDQDQLILGQSRDAKGGPESKSGFLRGYDPKTGTELWKCQGLNSFVYPSALYGNGVAVGMSGFGGSSLAVPAGGTGDVTKDRLWLHPKPANQRVGSGVIVGDHVYMVDENGTAHCYELKTGVDLWKDVPRLKGGTTWGSMVHADGRLYLLMRNASTVVMAADPKHEVLAVNPLGAGEQTNSSVAISKGDVFIRTFKYLWCVRAKKQ
ncbi:MAG TPA: PQQ-binding-like beta-propeller repeat protein [Tepidisphaeraceae bacterium]|nr:PQQ-binding-like beta-propeller repeat protein [Tepidisphaeraceae bacterium]